MKKLTSSVLGLLAAPIMPAVYFAFLYPISGYHDFASIYVTYMLTYQFALIGAVFLGGPIFFLMNKLKMVFWWLAMISGAFVSIVVRVTITSGNSVDFDSMVLFAALGGVAGLVFWIFWRFV